MAVLTAVLAVCVGWVWVETFYRGVSVIAQFAARSFDVPALAADRVHAQPILGHHYFGDFQLPLSYARDLRHSISPYLRPAPDRYPPFAQVLFVPLSYLSVHVSAAIYLGLSAVLFLVPLWLLLAPMHPEYRIIFLIPVAVLTTPFITLIDRGNNIGITVGLIAWTLWAWKSDRRIWCAVFLVAAIALKAYPMALLVVPLAFRRYKFSAIVASSAIALNLLVLVIYPGGFTRNLRAVVPALQGGYAPTSQLYSWSLYSVVPKTAGLIFGPSAADVLLSPKALIIWSPSILYMCGLYFVIRRGRVPQWCWGTLTLASIQVLVPVSYVYTTAWAALAAVWYAQGDLIDLGSDAPPPEGDAGHRTLRVMLLLALTATLAPSVFTISGTGAFQIPLTMYLSPALILLTLCTAIIESMQPVRSDALPVQAQATIQDD